MDDRVLLVVQITQSGRTARRGGGIQHYFPYSLVDLANAGYLREIPLSYRNLDDVQMKSAGDHEGLISRSRLIRRGERCCAI